LRRCKPEKTHAGTGNAAQKCGFKRKPQDDRNGMPIMFHGSR
jgi:hypothetical protein